MDIPQYRERTLTLVAHAWANSQGGKKHRSFWETVAGILSIPATSDATAAYFSNGPARQEMYIAMENATIFNCDTEILRFLETQDQVLSENRYRLRYRHRSRHRYRPSSAILDKIRDNALDRTITLVRMFMFELKELQQEKN